MFGIGNLEQKLDHGQLAILTAIYHSQMPEWGEKSRREAYRQAVMTQEYVYSIGDELFSEDEADEV